MLYKKARAVDARAFFAYLYLLAALTVPKTDIVTYQ